jgi:hypothetical protein
VTDGEGRAAPWLERYRPVGDSHASLTGLDALSAR